MTEEFHDGLEITEIPRRRLYDAAIQQLTRRLSEVEANLKHVQREHESQHALDVTIRERILAEISNVNKKMDQMTADLGNHITTEDQKFGAILVKLETQLNRLDILTSDTKPVVDFHHNLTGWASVNKNLVDLAKWLLPFVIGFLLANGVISIKQLGILSGG
jgi:hypothetical protein